MDPFHVVKLASDALDDVRRYVQQETSGHRRRGKNPLNQARRTLHTGTDLLTRREQERIANLFADANLTEVEVTWAVCQDNVVAYRAEYQSEGKTLLRAVIGVLSAGLPPGLVELRQLGRTVIRPAADVQAFLPGPEPRTGLPNRSMAGSNTYRWGPYHGLRNLTHYIAGCNSKPVTSDRF